MIDTIAKCSNFCSKVNVQILWTDRGCPLLRLHWRKKTKEAQLFALIRARADFGLQVSRVATFLHMACHHGLPTVVSELVQSRADVNALDVDGDDPLAVAVMTGHLGRTTILLNHVPLNRLAKRDKDGDSLITLAASSAQNTSIVSLLMRAHWPDGQFDSVLMMLPSLRRFGILTPAFFTSCATFNAQRQYYGYDLQGGHQRGLLVNMRLPMRFSLVVGGATFCTTCLGSLDCLSLLAVLEFACDIATLMQLYAKCNLPWHDQIGDRSTFHRTVPASIEFMQMREALPQSMFASPGGARLPPTAPAAFNAHASHHTSSLASCLQ